MASNSDIPNMLSQPGRFNMTGYPSGYDTWQVIFISIVVVFIMASIIIGNLLVIVAIFSEYTLQCVQNWFVASLAVSDLMLGIVVMPFSLSQEVVGYWLFGGFWCQVIPSNRPTILRKIKEEKVLPTFSRT